MATGVTYMRSRKARRAESTLADVYDRVYEAERPELFFKSPGWRVAGRADQGSSRQRLECTRARDGAGDQPPP
jgi:hypothetical protein